VAVTFPGTPASGNDTDGGATFTATVPSGLAAGETWIIAACMDDDNGTFDLPIGWEGAAAANFNDTWPRARVMFKPNCSGGESNQSVSMTGGGGNVEWISARAAGVATASVIGNVATDQTSAGGANTFPVPSITVQTTGNGVVGVFVQNDHGTATAPAPFGTVTSQNDGVGILCSFAGAENQTAGSFNPGDWGPTRPSAAGRAAQTVELIAAAEPGSGGGLQAMIRLINSLRPRAFAPGIAR
jgi:hypothetical protein